MLRLPKIPPQFPTNFNPSMDLDSLWAIRDLLDHPSCRLCFNSWVLSGGHAHSSDHRCTFCKRMRMIIAEIQCGDTTIQIRHRDRHDSEYDYLRSSSHNNSTKRTNYVKTSYTRGPKEFSSRPKEFC